MTAPAHPVERAQRVSDAVVEHNCQRIRAIASAGFELTSDERSWLDLEYTRALLAERDAEIARLRAALATARRNGWRKGRNAAAGLVLERMPGDVASAPIAAALESAALGMLALTPPAEEEGERHG